MMPKTCVLISYWVGHSARKTLFPLLSQLQKVDAGATFDVIVVCNGGDEKPLVLPSRYNSLRARIINRENTRYNIGAWDHGWRNSQYDYYLFLQDECYLKRPNWLADFEFRMTQDPKIGLLGEWLNWDRMTWSYVRASTDRDLGNTVWGPDDKIHLLDFYQQTIERHGIPLGETASHLPMIILFTSRRILEEINGFPDMGPSYREAVASEIGICKLVESRGYRVSKVRDIPYECIGHQQWTSINKLNMTMRIRISRLKITQMIKKWIGR